MATFEWPPNSGGGGSGVSSLNGLTGALNLVAGSNITITPLGSNITIAATGTTTFPLFAPDGTQAAPEYSFASNHSTGIYFNVSAGAVTTTVSNTDVFRAGETLLNCLVPLEIEDGSVGAPGLSFFSENSTGIYRPGSSELGFSIVGTLAARFNTSAALELTTANLRANDGSAGTPSISFINATTDGLYKFATNSVGFSTAGLTAGHIDASQNWTFVGTITASNFSGNSSGTNTGDVTLAAVGAVANANAASLTGQVLNLQPFSATFPGVVSASGGGTANFLRADGTWQAPSGSGTVSSVALADGSSIPIYTITGSPVTGAGTLTFTLSTETANTIFSGPTTGAAAQPTFRSLVANDIPGTLNGTTFTGAAYTIDGSAASPSFSFTNANNTGLYKFSANSLGFSTNGLTAGHIDNAQNWTLVGTVTASNLSGTNTGDVTLAVIGSTPNANAASLSGQVLNLQPASSSFGGVVTTGTQTFYGTKTIGNNTSSGGFLIVQSDHTSAGTTIQRVVNNTSGDFIEQYFSTSNLWTMGVQRSSSNTYFMSVGGTLGSSNVFSATTTGVVSIIGALQLQNTRTITTNATVGATDTIILCNQAGAIALTLPAATDGRFLIIKDFSGTAGTNNITITRAGSDVIDGQTTYVINQNYASVTLVGSSGNWSIV